jgi:FKBP-type peptidyl-prolyl cis-trans isomerase (trigger factor)
MLHRAHTNDATAHLYVNHYIYCENFFEKQMKNREEQDEEQLRNMITAENFNKYKEVVRKSVTRSLQLSLLLGAIAEKEGLTVNELEVDDQMELIRSVSCNCQLYYDKY